jgi:hypothetical protein
LLEEHWRNGAKAFSKSLASIADRRVRKAADMEVSQFSECIEESLETAIWHKTLDKAVDVIEIRVFKLSKQKPIFFNWIEQCRAKSDDSFERALNWRGLEILIARKLGKKQIEFDFDLDASEYNKQEDSSLRTAAEVFLSNEFGIPYYYGRDRLHTLASSNVEQFLMLAGDLFEESISQALIQNRSSLSTAQQHRIVMQASVRLWEEIPRRAGVEVHRFLHAIGSFSQWYTFRATAPNDPGVNGIAILMEDREKLMDLPYLSRRPELQAVAGAIAKAIQFNLLDASHGYRCKGKDFMVLNLNRLLCAKFGLPLNRGQFKEQNLETLSRWLSSGYLKPTEPNDLW